jgi:hypothetical protein
MVEPEVMTIPPAGLESSNTYAVTVQKVAQDQAKRDGAQIVDLIEQAAPPAGPDGEGTHVNTYA